MRFEDLKRVWREEETGEYKRVKIEDLSAAHGRASNHLNRMVRLGLRFLGIMLLITIPLWAWAAIVAPWPLLAWPCCLPAALTIAALHRWRRTTP